MLKIAFSPIYKYSLPEGHRFPMIKYELIPEQLLYEGMVTEDHFFHPVKMTLEELRTTHTADYLTKLENLTLTRREERDIGFPVREDLIHRGKHISHGTLECAYHAMRDGVSLNVAGGTHHAYSDRGEGFCVFNDIALAANILLQRGEAKQILVVDLDVHQGNGTAKIFEEDDRVFTFSMHGERNYPLRKEKSDLDIGLPDGAGDRHYLNILKDTLSPLIKKVKPDFIFYLSGVDVLKTDKLGRLALSKAGCKQRDLHVLTECKKASIPVAISMGGGYSDRVSDIVDAHCNTFRIANDLYF